MDSWFDRTSQICKSRKHICQRRKHAAQQSVDLMCKQFIFAIFGNFDNTLSASTLLYILIDVLLLILSGIFSDSPPSFFVKGSFLLFLLLLFLLCLSNFSIFFFTLSFSFSIFVYFLFISLFLYYFFISLILITYHHFLPSFHHFISFFLCLQSSSLLLI